MAERHPMPKWGLTMEEATIIEWLVPVGDEVAQGQAIALVETEKIEVELEAPVSGIIAAHLAAEGETVAVGADVVVIATDEDDYRASRSQEL